MASEEWLVAGEKEVSRVKTLNKENNILPVNFAAVGDVQNFYNFFLVVNVVNNAVVSTAQAVISGVSEFFTAEGAGIVFKIKNFIADSVLQADRQFLELMFSAGNDFNTIAHQACLCLRSSVRKFLNGREDWQARVSAIAKSIISSLMRLLWIRPNNIAFCSDLGIALNAVRNTCALVCIAVIIISPFCINLTQGMGNVKAVWLAGAREVIL